MMDKRKKAAAIQYDNESLAPWVSAKGAGAVAEKLLEKGKDENIPVISDPQLLDELMGIGIGESIPPELYCAVAQVLVFISNLDEREGEHNGPYAQMGLNSG
jgi:flagellar biosynthesis protein